MPQIYFRGFFRVIRAVSWLPVLNHESTLTTRKDTKNMQREQVQRTVLFVEIPLFNKSMDHYISSCDLSRSHC